MNNNKTEIFFRKVIEARWYICILFGFIALFGFYSLNKVKIDAIPDITNKQVIVNTKTYGMEPARIEKSVTYPIEAELYGIPGLTEMRSISKFGLSQIVLIFKDEVDIHFARNQVLQRISALGDQIPGNLKPEIAPLTTGIGEIIIYRVFNPNGDDNLMELRTTQQFQISRELKKVQGVAEVDTIGGFERELHLNVDSAKIINYGLTPEKLVKQIQTIGENFGGGYIEQDKEQKIVRTFSGIKNFEDVKNIPVKIDYTGKALPLSHIVEVNQDYTQRLGAATYEGNEAVIGTVMLQSGYNAKEVLINIKKEIDEWNKNNSAQIEILYDRQFLIDSTVRTVMKNLSEGILLVIGVLFLLLGNLRVGLIVASSIPFCILILASCMNIFGKDLDVIQSIGKDIENILKNISGTRSVIAERIASGYFLDVDFDREKLKIYGLSLKDAQDQAMTAIGGSNVSEIIAGRERYPIQVRLAPNFRQDEQAIKRILITTPTNAQIPLSEIAKINFNYGPSMIRNENASLVGYVYVDIDPAKTDIGNYVEEGRKLLSQKLSLPEGYLISWSGQFENMTRVKERLKMVIPLTLLLIVFLLYFGTKSWIKTSIVFLAVPFSLIGAVWILVLLDYNMSIAVWVGMIALLGLDAETGIFMLMYLDLAYDERVKNNKMNSIADLKEAIKEGAVHRVRPKLMTVTALFAGLIPIMWSVGAGSDVMKRIAAPMIGGLTTSFLMELLIYPIIFYIWKKRELKLVDK